MIKIAALLALGYLAICGLMFFWQARLLYFPDAQWAVTPEEVSANASAVTFSTADGVKLSAWWLPVENPRATVLFCHGNAGNISHRLMSIRQLQALGLSVLIFDYRGYGHSEGRPSEAGTYQDVMAAWRYLTVERGIAPERVVVFGRSLGAAIAAHLGARERPGLVILESPFTSVPDLAARFYPWLPVRWLSRLRYPVAQDVQAIRSPLLVMHSADDEVIPQDMGLRVYQLATTLKTFVALRGGHNDGSIVSEPDYSAAIDDFLDEHLLGAAGAD